MSGSDGGFGNASVCTCNTSGVCASLLLAVAVDVVRLLY